MENTATATTAAATVVASSSSNTGTSATDSIIACGLCARPMLHPVVATCGHAIGCRACVETYFESHIAINQKKRKATRIWCARCGEGFGKPGGGKKLIVDHTLGELCRVLKPECFGAGRAETAMDSLSMAVSDIKRRLVQNPIQGMPRSEEYHRKLRDYLDTRAKGMGDLHFCKCLNRIDHWSEGVPVYPKWSSKSSRWYLSCPLWTPAASTPDQQQGGSQEKRSCAFFKWVGSKDVARLGLGEGGDTTRGR